MMVIGLKLSHNIFRMTHSLRLNPLTIRILDTMNDAVIMTDRNRNVVFCNKKFCELTGYDCKDILYDNTRKFYNETTIAKVQYVDTHEREQGMASRYEGIMIHKSGKEIPVLISGSPLKEGGTIAVITNLTEIKATENLYKKLVENIHEAVWMGDRKERTIYINPKFTALTGYTLEELRGMQSYTFFDKKSVEQVRHINQTDRKKGISSIYEGNLVGKKGEIIPALVNGSPLHDGGTIAIISDLRLEKKHEQREKLLTTAIQHTTDAIITFDKIGLITSWNRGAQMMFGYKQKEAQQESIQKIFSESTLESILKHSEMLYNFEVSAQHKNKSILTISITVTPLHGSFLLIARDITQHIKIEEEMALKYQKIKEAYNQVGVIRRQMDYFFELFDLAAEHADLKSISDFVVTSVVMLTKVDACVLRIYNKEKNSLDLVSSFGVSEDWQGKVSIEYKNSLAERAFTKETPLKIIDVAKEPKYQTPFLAKKMNLSSLLLIPLRHRGGLMGTISLYANATKKLEIFENEFIEKYAKLIEIVLGNSLYSGANLLCPGETPEYHRR